MSSTPADRLKAARTQSGMSRGQLAARIGRAESTIRAHENGQNQISSEMADEYGRAIGAKASWILFGETNAAPGEDASVMRVAVEGVLDQGYYRLGSQPSTISRPAEAIYIAVPGYESGSLAAYFQNSLDNLNFSYVVISHGAAQRVATGDTVVVEMESKDSLVQRDVWKLEVSEAGSTYSPLGLNGSSTTSEPVSILKTQKAPRGFRVLGLVVARYAHRARPLPDDILALIG